MLCIYQTLNHMYPSEWQMYLSGWHVYLSEQHVYLSKQKSICPGGMCIYPNAIYICLSASEQQLPQSLPKDKCGLEGLAGRLMSVKTGPQVIGQLIP